MVDVTKMKAGMIIAQFEDNKIVQDTMMIVTTVMELTAETYAKQGTPYLPSFSIISLRTNWIPYREFDMPHGIQWYDVITGDGRLWMDQDSSYIESRIVRYSPRFIRLTWPIDWVHDTEISLVKNLTPVE